jgi:hypothetical protein
MAENLYGYGLDFENPYGRNTTGHTDQHHLYNTTTTTTTTTDYLLPPANTMSLLPPPKAIYSDPNTALTAVQLHAKQHGYTFKIHNKKASRVVFTCDRGGQYSSKGKDSKTHESRRRQTGSKKCGCLMKVELRLDRLSSQWMLQVLQGAHNYSPSTATTAHPIH